jgi:hypothetical protein
MTSYPRRDQGLAPRGARAFRRRHPVSLADELLEELIDGAIPSPLDIPTGLEKTSVIAIWAATRASAGGRDDG